MTKQFKLHKFLLTLIFLATLAFGAFVLHSYSAIMSEQKVVNSAEMKVDNSVKIRNEKFIQVAKYSAGYLTNENSLYRDISEAERKAKSSSTSEKEAGNKKLSDKTYEIIEIYKKNKKLNSDLGVSFLIDDLVKANSKVENAKAKYDKAVKNYNKTIKDSSNSFVAKLFHFEKK